MTNNAYRNLRTVGLADVPHRGNLIRITNIYMQPLNPSRCVAIVHERQLTCVKHTPSVI